MRSSKQGQGGWSSPNSFREASTSAKQQAFDGAFEHELTCKHISLSTTRRIRLIWYYLKLGGGGIRSLKLNHSWVEMHFD